MLILTRKEGEKLIINDNIVLEILNIDRGVVKVGIEAPREIPVLRAEIKEEIKSSNMASVKEVEDSALKRFSRRLK